MLTGYSFVADSNEPGEQGEFLPNVAGEVCSLVCILLGIANCRPGPSQITCLEA